MPPLLELDSISKRFGQVVVAEGISLSLEEGEAIGVVGPNGAGKTTLFSIISGDVRPDAGEVLLEGQRVTRLDAARRCRRGLGRTYQIPRPFLGLTVFENVLIAAQQGAGVAGEESYDVAARALLRTELDHLANRPAAELGLLHRKRLELARALATGPRVLLLDEVAAGLTDPEVRELQGIVAGARNDGIAVIWIEHVVRALVESVERLLCLSGGAIIADGDPLEVLSSDAVREVYLGTATPTIAT